MHQQSHRVASKRMSRLAREAMMKGVVGVLIDDHYRPVFLALDQVARLRRVELQCVARWPDKLRSERYAGTFHGA
jgi:hypothetical protein